MGIPRKIVSGGQTGVDRAALDVAIKLGIEAGGWCPRGRRAEDGPIEERYPLRETWSRTYSQRTEWNVRDSDATLILCRGTPSLPTAMDGHCWCWIWIRIRILKKLEDGCESKGSACSMSPVPGRRVRLASMPSRTPSCSAH